MADPIASLTFPMSDAAGDLVFSGNNDANPNGLLAMSRPGLVARITYADDSPHLAGSLATAATWQKAVLSATVELRGTSASDLANREARLRTVLGQFSYAAVQNRNGAVATWTCDTGSMEAVLDDDEINELAEFRSVWNLTIPVQPLGA